jgi:hypothetical protein
MPNFKAQSNQTSINNNTTTKTIVVSYTTKDSDRDYSRDEIDFEQNSAILNLNEYKRIPCVYGSLGYLFRNLKGRAYTVLNAVRFGLNLNPRKEDNKRLLELVNYFDDLDTASQNRVDVLDILTRKFKVGPNVLVEVFEQSLNYFANKSVKIAINANKGQLVDHATQKALGDSYKHTELMFKASNLIESEPLVSINEGDTIINNNNLNIDMGVLGNIQKDINRQLKKDVTDEDNIIEGEIIERKELTDGSESYIETGLIENKEELVNA